MRWGMFLEIISQSIKLFRSTGDETCEEKEHTHITLAISQLPPPIQQKLRFICKGKDDRALDVDINQSRDNSLRGDHDEVQVSVHTITDHAHIGWMCSDQFSSPR